MSIMLSPNSPNPPRGMILSGSMNYLSARASAAMEE